LASLVEGGFIGDPDSRAAKLPTNSIRRLISPLRLFQRVRSTKYHAAPGSCETWLVKMPLIRVTVTRSSTERLEMP
jgi:hypothetical protein